MKFPSVCEGGFLSGCVFMKHMARNSNTMSSAFLTLTTPPPPDPPRGQHMHQQWHVFPSTLSEQIHNKHYTKQRKTNNSLLYLRVKHNSKELYKPRCHKSRQNTLSTLMNSNDLNHTFIIVTLEGECDRMPQRLILMAIDATAILHFLSLPLHTC